MTRPGQLAVGGLADLDPQVAKARREFLDHSSGRVERRFSAAHNPSIVSSCLIRAYQVCTTTFRCGYLLLSDCGDKARDRPPSRALTSIHPRILEATLHWIPSSKEAK